MIKKIIQELEQKFGEKFQAELGQKTIEFYSDNHLAIYDRKKETLTICF